MERRLAVTVRDSVVPLVFISIVIVGLWPTIEGLVSRWLKFDEAYSHSFLVLLVSLYLGYQSWGRERPRVGFYAIWLIPFLLSAALYLAGVFLLIEVFQQLAIIPLIASGLLVIWGWRQTKRFIVPVGLLVLTLPVWDYLAWPLQLVTVSMTQLWLSWLDIEFVVKGILVYFPGIGAFEIAHGCSGLRYLIVCLFITVVYGELSYDRIDSKIILSLVGIFLAMAANWVRVFLIILIGYNSKMTSSLVHEHDFFGWLIFAVTLIPLFLLARRLESQDNDGNNQSPSRDQHNKVVPSPYNLVGAVTLTLVALGFTAMVWWAVPRDVSRAYSDPVSHHIEVFPPAEWLPLFKSNLSGWAPVVAWPDRTFTKVVMERSNDDTGPLDNQEVFIGLYSYDYQRPGNELIQYENRLYDSGKFLPVKTFTLNTRDGVELAGLSLEAIEGGQQVHIAYGYYVEGQWERDELQAKLAQLPGIFNARTDATLVVLGLTCRECDEEVRLEKLAPSTYKAVQEYLDRLYQPDV